MAVDQNQLRGWDAEELARRGAVSGSLLRQVRDHEAMAKRIKGLVLFGEPRSAVQEGDPPQVQLLIQQAAIYSEAQAKSDLDLKQRVLASMTAAILGLAGRHQSMFDSLLSLIKDVYKANLKANLGREEPTDRELIDAAAQVIGNDAAG